jgi:hypothetical protein
MNDEKTEEINEFENFDVVYAHELELQRELEKVEVAYVKTVERYGDYSDLKSFVGYLCTVEKMFTENKYRNRGFEQGKDEMIKLRIKILAKSTTLSEELLNTIYNYFKKAGQTADKIFAIAKELLEKHKQEPECEDFILYVQDTCINFLNAEKEHLSMDELKDRLIRARMDVISSKGKPELLTLENIYKEFRALLSK